MPKTERLEFRVSEDEDHLIRRASEVAGADSVSAFIVAAVVERAQQVITDAATTVVPADFFDQIVASLDEVPEPNAALLRLAGGRRHVKHA